MYDICIVGAGVVGCAIARELARQRLKICLIEKNEDVGAATTKANSGIVHGGYADKPGTLKAKLCVRGNELFDQLERELHFGFRRTGSFVVGFDEQDRAVIDKLYLQGQSNGVPELKIVDGEFVLAREPFLQQQIKFALYCPSAGVVSPYEFTIALAENAVHNGVELRLNTTVTAVENHGDYFTLISDTQHIDAKIVVNAAGLYADAMATMVGVGDFTITPRAGQYLLFDREEGDLVGSVVFQTPSALSKGILVTTTYHGNLLIGPDATVVPDKEYLDTAKENIEDIVAAARKVLPNFDLRKVITTFAGNRAASTRGDFIIEESSCRGFINVAAIESPGLTASPAIAQEVSKLIRNSGRVSWEINETFDPHRRPIEKIAEMSSAQLREIIARKPHHGCVVCHCELVSHGEISDALHREIPVRSLDALKRRTRATMGRCQGGFCSPKLMAIIGEELGIVRTEITKKGGESFFVTKSVKMDGADE